MMKNLLRQITPRMIKFIFAAAVAVSALHADSDHSVGAFAPWRTYEAEAMQTNGTVLGPRYDPYQVETEASGERCTKLSKGGEFVEFTAQSDANTLIVRYSLPDSNDGAGRHSKLSYSINGKAGEEIPLTSEYSWLYGNYPFTNQPKDGKPRNFYDEVRVSHLQIHRGDVVRLSKAESETPYALIDLVDLEEAPAALKSPAGAIALTEAGAVGDGVHDDTNALRQCIDSAVKTHRPIWAAPGNYKITGDITVPSGVHIQGAGIWHTTFVGDPQLYKQADRRVRFRLKGDHIALADFAILGRLNYRNDQEPNDGIVTAGCADSKIERIWIEHTKTGIWVYNGTRLQIKGCRLRDLLADGINLCVGTSETIVENCSTRGTGDDCFAIWPSPSDQGFVQATKPGHNVIRHCTGQLPFLANGGALYGGVDNRISDCLFTDITAGCGILISTTFPTTDEARQIDNNFSGTTTIERCTLQRCGGYDHDWTYRGSFQICLDQHDISGLAIKQVEIDDSISDAFTVIAPRRAPAIGNLSNTILDHVIAKNPGMGTPMRRGLYIFEKVSGDLTLSGSQVQPIQNDAKNFAVSGAK